MANNADLIRERLAQFRRTPRGYGRVLRNSLSRIIVDRLEEHGWSQRQLAEAAGMRESFISRVIHGASNCTFDVAGRILHAVGAPAAVYDTTEYTVVPAPLLAQSDQTLSDDDDRQTEIASYIRITARPICRFTVQGEDDVIWAAPGPPDNMVFHGSDLDPQGRDLGKLAVAGERDAPPPLALAVIDKLGALHPRAPEEGEGRGEIFGDQTALLGEARRRDVVGITPRRRLADLDPALLDAALEIGVGEADSDAQAARNRTLRDSLLALDHAQKVQRELALERSLRRAHRREGRLFHPSPRNFLVHNMNINVFTP